MPKQVYPSGPRGRNAAYYNLVRNEERDRHNEEVQLANELLEAAPELSRSQALREAARILGR